LDLWLILPEISTQITRRIVKLKKTVAPKELQKTSDHQQKKSPRKRKEKVKAKKMETSHLETVKPTNQAVTSLLEKEKEKNPRETSQAVTSLLETEKEKNPRETSPAVTNPKVISPKETSPPEINPKETPRIGAWPMKTKRVQKDVVVKTSNVTESKT